MPIARPTLTKLAEYDVRNGQSQRATLALGEVSLTRKFLVKWEETGLVAQHFLGYSRIFGGRLERLLPATHPRDPALICTKISLDYGHKFLQGVPAQTDGSTAAAYEKACVTAEYQRPTYTLLTDAECPATEEYRRYTVMGDMESTGDSITLPGHTLKLLKPGGGGPIDPTKPLDVPYNVPKTFTSMRMTWTWARLPANFASFFDTDINTTPGSTDGQPWLERVFGDPLGTPAREPYLGCVNKYQFGRFKPGQLLFERFRVVRKPAPFVVNIDGPAGELFWQSPAMEQDIEMSFRFCPQTWLRLFWMKPLSSTTTSDGTADGSGWYYVGRGTQHYSVENTPDFYSLANVRDLKHLFRVDYIA